MRNNTRQTHLEPRVDFGFGGGSFSAFGFWVESSFLSFLESGIRSEAGRLPFMFEMSVLGLAIESEALDGEECITE